MVSATEPDWAREKPVQAWDPGRKLLKTIRSHQRLKAQGGPIAKARRMLVTLRYHFWSVVSGAEIPLNTEIGGGLMIPHPNGVVIHPKSVIGPNCLIMQQVTLGIGRVGDPPCLGGHVDVGAGAKLIGPIKIGDGARIGANAVVLADVPAGATAVGAPARSIVKS